MIGALLGELWPYLIAALGAIATVGGAWLAGTSKGRQAGKTEALKDYQTGRKEIDHADVSVGDSSADAEWLRDRAKR